MNRKEASVKVSFKCLIIDHSLRRVKKKTAYRSLWDVWYDSILFALKLVEIRLMKL